MAGFANPSWNPTEATNGKSHLLLARIHINSVVSDLALPSLSLVCPALSRRQTSDSLKTNKRINHRQPTT